MQNIISKFTFILKMDISIRFNQLLFWQQEGLRSSHDVCARVPTISRLRYQSGFHLSRDQGYMDKSDNKRQIGREYDGESQNMRRDG